MLKVKNFKNFKNDFGFQDGRIFLVICVFINTEGW